MLNIRVPQSGVNAFCKPIPSLPELLNDPVTNGFIQAGLDSIFSDIGLTEPQRHQVVERCLEATRSATSLSAYEQELHRFLEEQGVLVRLSRKIEGRAERMAELALPRLRPGSVLDLGCGAGQVGRICADNGYEVTLADVYEHDRIASLGLPFVTLRQEETLPFVDQQFDNVLVFAMLHHVENPLLLIKEIRRLMKPRGRVHLIETIYGMQVGELLPVSSGLERHFATLTEEQQRHATMFFDYFGNHVTWYYTEAPEKYVPVPFNFNTPTFWQKAFTTVGFRCLEVRPWHIDPPSSVMHYTLMFEASDE